MPESYVMRRILQVLPTFRLTTKAGGGTVAAP